MILSAHIERVSVSRMRDSFGALIDFFFAIFKLVRGWLFVNKLTVYGGGVCRLRALATGDRWHVTCDKWHGTCDTDMWHFNLCIDAYMARYVASPVCGIFKASALWAKAFYNSICPSVCPPFCLSVCLSVCSLLRYRLNVFFPHFLRSDVKFFLEIRNSWGNVMERSGPTFENFYK